jgi:hypothetical protein
MYSQQREYTSSKTCHDKAKTKSQNRKFKSKLKNLKSENSKQGKQCLKVLPKLDKNFSIVLSNSIGLKQKKLN